MPITWGAYIFIYNVGFFIPLWEISQRYPAWTWALFGPNLVHAILLYLSASLILSSDELAVELGMMGNFDKHGRLALIPMALFFMLAIPFNRLSGGPTWMSLPNLLNVVLTALIVVVFSSRRKALRSVATLAVGAVSALGWLVIWARPGDG
jgi:ABC-type polysaccharide/polyol phosphate export permease